MVKPIVTFVSNCHYSLNKMVILILPKNIKEKQFLFSVRCSFGQLFKNNLYFPIIRKHLTKAALLIEAIQIFSLFISTLEEGPRTPVTLTSRYVTTSLYLCYYHWLPVWNIIVPLTIPKLFKNFKSLFWIIFNLYF